MDASRCTPSQARPLSHRCARPSNAGRAALPSQRLRKKKRASTPILTPGFPSNERAGPKGRENDAREVSKSAMSDLKTTSDLKSTSDLKKLIREIPDYPKPGI